MIKCILNNKLKFIVFVGLYFFSLIFANAWAQPVNLNYYPSISDDYVFETGIIEKSDKNNISGVFLEPLPRFFYTNFVMLTSSIAGHFYLYLRTTDQDWQRKFSWKNIEKSFTMPPQREEDHWTFNYMVHPYMGSLTYLASRNRGGKPLPSLFFSTVNSAMYEYFVASSLQRPSINDMIITPLGGMLLGEGLFVWKKYMLKDSYLTFTEKIIYSIIDPYEVLRIRLNFSKLIYSNK